MPEVSSTERNAAGGVNGKSDANLFSWTRYQRVLTYSLRSEGNRIDISGKSKGYGMGEGGLVARRGRLVP
jgi:hypothetical protein